MEIGIDAYRAAAAAAFTSRPDLLQKALANPGEPVKFAFTSVSLLTPDFVRGDFKIKGPHGNEKAMLEAQNRAYEKLNGAVIDVPDPGTGAGPRSGREAVLPQHPPRLGQPRAAEIQRRHRRIHARERPRAPQAHRRQPRLPGVHRRLPPRLQVILRPRAAGAPPRKGRGALLAARGAFC